MGKEDSLRVFLVGPLRLYREALARALAVQATLDVVGTGAPAEALEKIAGLEPDVVLLDLDEPRARRLARAIREHSAKVRLLVLGAAHSQKDAVSWAEAGVLSWTGRDAAFADLVAGLEGAARVGLGYDSDLVLTLVRRIAELPLTSDFSALGVSLTRREAEVAELIGHGLTNKQIAQLLTLSPWTVKNHVHKVITKFGAEDRGEVAERVRELKRGGPPGAI